MAGDVHVWGASYATSQAIRATIERATGRHVVMHGVVGATLAEWSRNLPPPNAYANGESVYVLELGGNGVPNAAKVREVDEKLRATGAPVTWFVFDGWPDARIRQKRIDAGAVVRSAARTVVTVATPLLAHIGADGTHLTTDGYIALGGAMARSAYRRAGGASGLALVLAAVLLLAVGAQVMR